jgi:hypothetical protein
MALIALSIEFHNKNLANVSKVTENEGKFDMEMDVAAEIL